ncbi:MAG: hypothetical protein IPK84_05225 [Candidatus Moraniibacteriota bacterium]|nr:MAG: hypothetical protein IPK84_05225 [Candidatus Moranbacteria bacterium]
MKRYLFSFFVCAMVAFCSQPVSAASCSVRVPFSGPCELYFGYGSGIQQVNAPATITLSGSPDNPDKPTHFNCRPAPGTQGVPVTPGGWVLVKNGPSRNVPSIPGAVTMPSEEYGGLASDGAALTCLAMLPNGN